MRIAYSQLKKLPAVTVSGTHLGSVSDALFDTESGMLVQIHVKRSLFSKPLVIARSQIVRFEEEKVVVDDAIERDVDEASGDGGSIDPEPALMSEID